MQNISGTFARDSSTPKLYTLVGSDLEEMFAEWLGYGHEPEALRKAPDGLWVTIRGGGTLHVQPGRIVFHGEISDDAIAAGIRHAQDAWNNKMHVHGTEDFKLRTWAHAQIAGVAVLNYHPPAHLMDEADDLVSHHRLEMLRRSHGAFCDSLEGPIDNRPWGYREAAPSERDQEMSRRVHAAAGLHPTAHDTI